MCTQQPGAGGGCLGHRPARGHSILWGWGTCRAGPLTHCPQARVGPKQGCRPEQPSNRCSPGPALEPASTAAAAWRCLDEARRGWTQAARTVLFLCVFQVFHSKTLKDAVPWDFHLLSDRAAGAGYSRRCSVSTGGQAAWWVHSPPHLPTPPSPPRGLPDCFLASNPTFSAEGGPLTLSPPALPHLLGLGRASPLGGHPPGPGAEKPTEGSRRPGVAGDLVGVCGLSTLCPWP